MPTLGQDVKAVNAVGVLIFASSEDDKLVIIHNRGCMTPSSTRKILASNDLDALDDFCPIIAFQELFHVEYVQFIEVNILQMTPSKRIHFRFLYRICHIKPLCHKILCSSHIWLDPLQFKVKSPKVIEIQRVWLTVHEDHTMSNKIAGMTRAIQGDDWLLTFDV